MFWVSSANKGDLVSPRSHALEQPPSEEIDGPIYAAQFWSPQFKDDSGMCAEKIRNNGERLVV